MSISNEPLVSICCITYNHEKYIRDAIEGFLMQKTDFPFEIIIHDDASTDTTAEIIREYERANPDLIKPIYQTENQYSKGERVSLFVLRAARGKYIALCEGDDFWIDPLKLQKQITEMERHPECHISFHPATLKKVNGEREDRVIGMYSKNTRIFPIERVIKEDGAFMPTASIVLNAKAISRIISFFTNTRGLPIGDYYIQVLGSENGGALYLIDTMSVYRMGMPDSWTEKNRVNPNNIISLSLSLIRCNEKLDAFMNNKYSKVFHLKRNKIYSNVVKSLYLDIDEKRNLINLNIKNIGIANRILWGVVFKHPFIVNIIKGIVKLRTFILLRMASAIK